VTVEQPQLCPNCFKEIAPGIEVCPACGERIAALSGRDYTAKLVHALDHPLADVRMRAIIALGLRGEAPAALAACTLRHSADIVE
jgi:HEAT repeat protein